MSIKFNLRVGESKTHVQGGKIYQISCDTFRDHDHKNKPLYLYHDKQQDNDLIATIEGNDDPPYDSPFSSDVNGQWIVFRENIVIHCSKNETCLEVEIEEK